ncbi:hypothetical protein DFJ73DRAFT_173945 [Zopfochytrium polystomum]|nr:hypothetical protein DFJ73DRAFT_173945 [Zopfochytrium polystomum]
MKIKKAPPRRLGPPVPAVASAISLLRDCPEEALPEIADKVAEWNLPKSDFFHWIAVLDRFDSLLESAVEKAQLKSVQVQPLDSNVRSTVLAVLRISKVLFDNCTNRNLYNSFEHVSNLLNSNDVDVLLATLQFLFRPSQRMGRQKSSKLALGLAEARVITLAQGTKTRSVVDIAAMVEPETQSKLSDATFGDGTVPQFSPSALMHRFYRSSPRADDSFPKTVSSPDPTVETSALTDENDPPLSPTKSSKSIEATATSNTNGEGLVLIYLADVLQTGKTEDELFVSLIEEYNVPPEERFALLHKLRIAFSANLEERRQKLFLIRIWAIAVAVSAVSEEICSSKLFLTEPDLTQKLGDLVHASRSTSFEVQTAAFAALEAISRSRNRASDVLSAVNASANHGAVLQAVKRIAINLSEDFALPQDYIDSVFNFMAQIISVVSGGNMVVAAGIITILTQALSLPVNKHFKNVTKFVTTLDSIIYGYSNSFPSFASANGLEHLVSRVKEEIEQDISLYGENSMEQGEIPYERVAFLRSLLKFIMHMMQTSGSPDQMRNLIETSLPGSVLAIFEKPKFFGANILGLAITIMSTFVHNEPTSLSILQESQLHTAFLKVAVGEIPWSPEVISALPSAFGAICLNQAGLDAFNEAKPIPAYLQILTNDESLRHLQDKDLPHLVGISIDELMRHHPSLKQTVMDAIVAVLQEIIGLGQTVQEEDRDLVELGWKDSLPMESPEGKREKREPRISTLIDVFARFLEGLFQNPAHCKDFIKLNGAQLLVKLFFLPTIPLDFALSSNQKSLTYILRALVESSATTVLPVIMNGISEAFEKASTILQYRETSWCREFIEVDGSVPDKALAANSGARALSVLHCFVRLFQDSLSAQNVSHGKSVTIISNALGSGVGEGIVKAVGLLHRFCFWENILLKSSVPKEWFEAKPKRESADEVHASNLLSRSSSVDELTLGPDNHVTPAATESGYQDYRVRNTQFFRGLFVNILSTLTPTYQSIIRLLSIRRISDGALRKQASRVIDSIAQILVDALLWTPSSGKNLENLRYLSMTLHLVAVMVLDDKHQNSLQTPLVNAFVNKGGSPALLNLVKVIWTDVATEERHREEKLDLLDILMSILATFSHPVAAQSSPFTASLQGREKDRGSPEFFDVADFIVSCRLSFFPTIEELWTSDKLTDVASSPAGANFCRGVTTIVSQIVKGEGETVAARPTTDPSLNSGSAIANIAQALFGRAMQQPVSPDPALVQQIMEIGYPQFAAENALRRFNNQLPRAVDYLISNPAALFETGPSSSSRTVQPLAQASTVVAVDTANTNEPNESSGATEIPGAPSNLPLQSDSAMEDADESAMLERALQMSVGASNGGNDSEMRDSSSEPLPIDSKPSEAEVKGKGRATEGPSLREQLDAKRDLLKASLVERSLHLLGSSEKIVFDVRDILCLVSKTNPDSVVNAVNAALLGSLKDVGERASRFASELRLLALLLIDSSVQLSVRKGCSEVIRCLSAPMSDAIGRSDGSSHQPKWLASAILVLDAALALDYEPKAIVLRKFNDEGCPSEPEKEDVVPESLVFSKSDKMQLLSVVQPLLKAPGDKDTAHALLQFIMRLTADYDVALSFSKTGGLEALLTSPFTSSFANLSLTILRHTFETSMVVSRVFELRLSSWMTGSRARSVDINNLLKSNAHFAARNPEAFVKVVAKMCHLPKYDSSARIHSITLRDNYMESLASKEPLVAQSTLTEMEEYVHFLISELLRFQYAESPGNAGESSHKRHLARGFILIALDELFLNFPFLRAFAVQGQSAGKPASRGSKQPFLHHLLNDLLPYGLDYDASSATIEASNRFWESARAGHTVSVLCDASSLLVDASFGQELLSVRKVVVESIVRAFKEASSSTESINAKYSRFLALSELCFNILPMGLNSNSAKTEESSSSVAKIMLEKGVVNLLTGVLAEIDIHHPSARRLTAVVLKPLELLAKVAIRLARAPETSAKSDEADAMSTDEPTVGVEVEEELQRGGTGHSSTAAEQAEISDIFRNSSLGLFNVPQDEDGDAEDDDDDDDEDDDDDDGYEEYDEEEYSGEEDEDDEDDDDSDMEIVVPAPYQGAQEPVESADEDIDEDEEGVEVDDDGNEMSWTDEAPDDEADGEDEDEDGEEEIVGADVVNGDPVEDGDDEGDDENVDDEADDDGSEGSDEDDYASDEDIDYGIGAGPFEEVYEGVFHGGGGADDLLQAFGGVSRRQRRPRRLSYTLDANRLENRWDSRSFRETFGIFGNNDLIQMQDFGAPRVIDASVHPLLVEEIVSTPQSIGEMRNLPNQAIGSTLHEIERLLLAPGGPGEIFALARNGHARIDIEEDGRHTTAVITAAPPRRGASARDGVRSPVNEDLYILHSASPSSFNDRWTFEGRALYGAQMIDKMCRLCNPILHLLIPSGILERREKERERREAEEKEQAEREANLSSEATPIANQANDETKASAADPASALPHDVPTEPAGSSIGVNAADLTESAPPALEGQPSSSEDVQMAEVTPSTAQQEASAPSQEASNAEQVPPAPARVIVQIGGDSIDITDTGIDPEFLEALPEDLRMEVLNQHMQERQREQQRRSTVPPPRMPDNPDLSDFLEALPPEIRDEVLSQQRPTVIPAVPAPPPAVSSQLELDPASFLEMLDPVLRQAALDQGMLRQRPRPASTGIMPSNGTTGSGSRPVKRTGHKEAVLLVEKSGLMILLRLLFVPEPANKGLIQRLLLNLIENSRTRMDLVSLMLSILTDGSGEVLAVDKSFSQLSIKGKNKATMPTTKRPQLAVTELSTLAVDSVPNLVPQRCLEALLFLVSNNERLVHFFLTENEGFGIAMGKTRATPKKAKGKEKIAMTPQSPVTVLLGLLEKPVFLANHSLLEQLVQLLASVLRPISSLFTNESKAETTETSVPKDGIQAGPTEAAAVTTTKESKETPEATPAASTTKKGPKPPTIPDYLVRAVVRILTTGDCSSKTFQHTLSMIQHLSALGSVRNIIVAELMESAQSLANSIGEDLQEVAVSLDPLSRDVDVNSGPLAKFSSSSSQQAKLLRVLKTVDFLFSKTVVETASKDAERGTSSKQTAANHVVAVLESLASAYNRLDLLRLWLNLGSALNVITASPHLNHIGTILLPSIEAFMVISKPYVIKKAGVPRLLPSISSTAVHSSKPSKDASLMTPDEMFFAFTEENRKILNSMVRNNPSLMSGSFSLLVQNPKMLEFDNKRTYFNQQLHKRTGREQFGVLQVNVRRAFVFEDSYHQLHGKNGDEVKYGKLNVRFHDEEGVDVGGVTREWFSALARQMFNPDYALFKPSAVDKVTYQPNRASEVNPDHLLYFRFVGRIIGKAIYDGRLLDCYFTRSFYKAMLEIPVDWKDMEAIDPEFHKSLAWMLNNDITDVMDLTFSTEVDDFGIKRIVELKPNGSKIEVTEENKTEYVALITEQRLVKAIKQQIDAFLGGFHDIIPKNLIKIFNEQELELLISGLPDIDVDDWKNNTEYHNYNPTSPQIQWFWRAVRSFSQEERAKLIQFATGTSKVPLEGFKALEGSGGSQKFNIHKDFSSKSRLPSAHTCFNQMDLPEYESYEQLRNSLLLAISEGGTGLICPAFLVSYPDCSVHLGFGFA